MHLSVRIMGHGSNRERFLLSLFKVKKHVNGDMGGVIFKTLANSIGPTVCSREILRIIAPVIALTKL